MAAVLSTSSIGAPADNPPLLNLSQGHLNLREMRRETTRPAHPEDQAVRIPTNWIISVEVGPHGTGQTCLQTKNRSSTKECRRSRLGGFSSSDGKAAVIYTQGDWLTKENGEVFFISEHDTSLKRRQFKGMILVAKAPEKNIVAVLHGGGGALVLELLHFDGTSAWTKNFPGEQMDRVAADRLQFSSRGNQIALATDPGVEDGRFRTFNLDGSIAADHALGHSIFRIAPDGNRIAILSNRRQGLFSHTYQLSVWNISNNHLELQTSFPSEERVHYFLDDISPDSTQVLMKRIHAGNPAEKLARSINAIIVVDLQRRILRRASVSIAPRGTGEFRFSTSQIVEFIDDGATTVYELGT